MRRTLIRLVPALLVFAALGFTVQQDEETLLRRRAEKLHDKLIAVDTHTDTALELIKPDVDPAKVQAGFAKLRAGRPLIAISRSSLCAPVRH